MRNKTYSLLIYMLGFSLIGLTSCLEEIDLDIPKGFDETFIFNGKITIGEVAEFNMQVSRLFDFTAEGRGRVNARDAIITDESGNSMTIPPVGQGVYRHQFSESDPIQIEVGKSYKVQISTFDGRTYESTMEPILPKQSIETLMAVKTSRTFINFEQRAITDTIIQFRINTSLLADGNAEKSYLRWELSRVFQVTDSPIDRDIQQGVCYVTGNLAVPDVQIFDGPNQTKTELVDFPIYDLKIDLNRELGEGYYFTAVQETISPTAHDYWSNVKEVIEREGDIFAAPAGKVISNFRNINDPNDEVFGYFYAATQDTARFFIDPEFAGNQPSRCPSEGLVNPDGSCGDALCCDCERAENSSPQKPHYWDR